MAIIGSAPSVRLRWGLTFTVPALAAAFGAWRAGLVVDEEGQWAYPWVALSVAAATMLLIFWLLELIGSHGSDSRRPYGWCAVIIGEDGFASTSKTQVFAWTVVLATGLAYLSAIAVLAPDGSADVFGEADWEQYLLVLGGPFAAAIAAKGITTAKAANGKVPTVITTAAEPEKVRGVAALMAMRASDGTAAAAVAGTTPPPDAGTPRGAEAKDLISNDDGDTDLVDTQYLVFTVVAIAYVVGTFISGVLDLTPRQLATGTGFGLPEIPAVLLALTSGAALTYVGNKAVQGTSPKIVSVSNLSPKAGDTLDIIGLNLAPVGITGAANATTVTVVEADGTGYAVGVLAATSTTVRFTMPGVAPGTVQITVVTAGATATAPYPLAVQA